MSLWFLIRPGTFPMQLHKKQGVFYHGSHLSGNGGESTGIPGGEIVDFLLLTHNNADTP